jgi:hypothetical protein
MLTILNIYVQIRIISSTHHESDLSHESVHLDMGVNAQVFPILFVQTALCTDYLGGNIVTSSLSKDYVEITDYSIH